MQLHPVTDRELLQQQIRLSGHACSSLSHPLPHGGIAVGRQRRAGVAKCNTGPRCQRANTGGVGVNSGVLHSYPLAPDWRAVDDARQLRTAAALNNVFV